MTDNIKISTREEAGISEEAVYALVKDAYRKFSDNGLDVDFFHTTLEEYKEFVHNAIVLVAVDTETGELIGTRTLKPNRDKKYVHECRLAVSPKARQRGIATSILQFEEAYFRQAGFDYLRCATPVNAVWSVKWHRKNGYRIIGYIRIPTRSCGNYVFRKQLSPSLLWAGPLAPITAGISLFWKTSICYLPLFGQIVRFIVRTIKKFSFSLIHKSH